MSDTVRVLNDEGIRIFAEYLEKSAGGHVAETPWAVLGDRLTSDSLKPALPIERKPEGVAFRNRYDFGRYLCGALAVLPRADISLNSGIWNWLALYYLDQLAPPNPDGSRNVLKDQAAYILDKRFVWRRYYRHLVRGPWLAVSLHPVSSRSILYPLRRGVPLGTRGELYEQIASRQTLFRSKAVMAAVDSLYFDSESMSPRAGAGGSEGGSPRRFGSLMNQLGLTHDVEWDDRSLLPKLLPREFERWKRHS